MKIRFVYSSSRINKHFTCNNKFIGIYRISRIKVIRIRYENKMRVLNYE